MFDLISIGDPTIDTFLKINDAHVACNLNRQSCQICVNYASKIPVEDFFRFPAGNMPNNAIGAAKLGLKTAVYGVVGKDREGEWIEGELKKEAVETKFVQVDAKRQTNSSTVIVFQKERTILVWHEAREYKLPPLPKADWLYLTSIGPLESNLPTFHKQILGYLKSHPTKFAFNPGTYQLLLGRDTLLPLFKKSEVVLLNKEETGELTGKKTSDIKVLLRAFKELGANTVVITDGPNGSFAYDGKRYFALGIFDTPVVERTGAGDSYSTGFVSALHWGLSIPEAMRWGTFNAAYVVGQYGGILGLVNKKTMEKLSEEHPELRVREI